MGSMPQPLLRVTVVRFGLCCPLLCVAPTFIADSIDIGDLASTGWRSGAGVMLRYARENFTAVYLN